MTQAITQPIQLPANAEIIIEGEVLPQPEGDSAVMMRVTAITHREGAVFPVICTDDRTAETRWLNKAVERLFLPLLKLVLDEIVDINLPTQYGLHNLALVSIHKRHAGQAQKVMHGIWGMGKLAFTRIVIVVDADVDVQDLSAVAGHMLEWVDFRRDVLTSYGMIHDPRQPDALGGKVGINATRKSDDAQRHWKPPIDLTGLDTVVGYVWRLFASIMVIQAPQEDAHTLIQSVWQHTPYLHAVIVSDEVNLDDPDELMGWILSHLKMENIEINDAGAVGLVYD